MELNQIKELIQAIHASNVGEFDLKNGHFELRIRTDRYSEGKELVTAAPMAVATAAPIAAAPAPLAAPAAPAAAETTPEEDTSNLIEIKSPIVGTFYRSSSPDKPVFVKVGDVIGDDDVVCLIEAMKLFNEIKAEQKGRIVKVMVEDATPVEYDQVLFLVDPS